MPYNSKVLGFVISRERIRMCMTQEQLAGLSQISRSHLAALESGVKTVKLDTLWKIADALGMKPSGLLTLVEFELDKTK